MARKLKTYQTSLGFFDLAIAAPSMKAALQAWGSETNLFQQGFAKETDDPAIVAATLAKPGVVLRRPVGSDGAFSEHAELPKELPIDKERTAKPRATTKNRGLRRSTTKQHARRRWRSKENASGARASAGRKRPRGRRNASGASRQSQRPKPPLKKRSVTMKPRSKKSKVTALHSTDGRKRRMRAGKSRRRSWKPHCAGRATSHVAMSQDARRIDPSVGAGAKPAPSPDFIEPCRPALHEEAPSGERRMHEIKFDRYADSLSVC